MGPLLRIELKRALGNRLFLACMILGVGIAIAAAVESIVGFYAEFDQVMGCIDDRYMSQFAQGAYTLWMPASVMKSVPNLFFFIAPLLVGLSYSWSWRSDMKSGYAALMLIRCPRDQWYVSKALATFVAGGLVVCIPLLLNLVILLCSVPAFMPDIVDVVYTGLWRKVFLSELFYTCPPAYVAVRFLLDFVLSGLWATTVLALSLFIRNRVAIVTLPYIGLIAVKYVSETLYVMTGVDWGALTILDHLKARGDRFYYGWEPLCIGLATMLVVSIALPLLVRKRDVL